MNKSTQKTLLIGAGLAVAYYLWKQSSANAANAETPTEAAQSAASTLSAQLNAMFPG